MSMSTESNDATSVKDDTSSTSSLQVPPFLPNQKVFAVGDDSGSLYEAVIRKTSWTGQHWKFFVHYSGWNARWDKWLLQHDIHEDSPELRASQKKRKRESVTASTEKKSKTTAQKERMTYHDYCELPFTLKTILVKDRERIMRLGFDAPVGLDCNVTNWRPARDVHQVPSKVTIQTVLNHYVKFCKKKNTETKARAFCNDLAKMFDEALPVLLLYPPERAQHAAIQAHAELSKLRNVEIYGCEHLLRLFVRLPVLLEEVPSQAKRKDLGSQISDLIVLLQKNRQACFKARYREPQDDELNDWEKALRNGEAPVDMDE